MGCVFNEMMIEYDKFKFKFKDLYSSVYKYSTLDGYNKDILVI